MPPKPTLRKYAEPAAPSGGLHPVIREYLLTGDDGGRDAPEEVRMIAFEPDRAARLWKKHRGLLLREARRREFSPFGLWRFEGKTLPGLSAWKEHIPNPLPTLGTHGRVIPCPHCGSADTRPSSCLA